jgi:hypothetical protein
VVGNFDQVKETLLKRPTILHISCHGADNNDSFRILLEHRDYIAREADFNQKSVEKILYDPYASKMFENDSSDIEGT